jgi:cobalt-precorrin 5A hydrolase/precorrin-3B C17-methyltransferase
MKNRIAIVALHARGVRQARTLAGALPDARVHAPRALANSGEHGFDDVGGHLRALFAAGTAIVAVMASGIVVRVLAPLLTDKRREPPVIALSEDGRFAVPLLGGHRGANRLAHEIAGLIDGTAAMTTASESALGIALDDPPPGWRIANPKAAKGIAADLLAGKPVALMVEASDAKWLAPLLRFQTASFPRKRESSINWTPPPPEGRPITIAGRPAGGAGVTNKKRFGSSGTNATRAVLVTDRAVNTGASTLVLNPPTLAVGVGCERGASVAEMIRHVRAALKKAGLTPTAVACVASLDLKADENAVTRLAADLGVPARFFTAKRLERERPRLRNPSNAVFAAVGCHGVAEGAALAAAGAKSELIVAKSAGPRVTVAIARSPRDIDPGRVGRARGALAVVGLGPGTPELLTPRAEAAIAAATDIVGYGLYLDFLGATTGKQRHDFPLGAETERVDHALKLAAQGKTVALVASGDPGIYALATLVFERMEKTRADAARRISVDVVPGVSSMLAGAALAGAPLGHDFAVISLSDLLTPWPAIEARLEAAAQGDFAVVLFNPVSKRRRWQLAKARDILLTAREPETPVAIVHDVGRPSERLVLKPLGALTTDDADMTTLVIVGARATRALDAAGRRWVYTPRGYAKKGPTRSTTR